MMKGIAASLAVAVLIGGAIVLFGRLLEPLAGAYLFCAIVITVGLGILRAENKSAGRDHHNLPSRNLTETP